MRNLASLVKPKRKHWGKSTSAFDVGQTTTHHCNHQEVEVYISLYYHTCIKPHVRAHCETEKLTSVSIVLIHKVAMNWFSSEEEEIREAIEKEISCCAKAATKTLVNDMEVERTPEQYQQ